MCGLERRMTTRAVPHECHTKVITAPLCAYLWVCVEGLSSFLPNVSYLQPPGWVHHLINRTWQPLGLRIRWVAPEGRQPVDAYGSRWNNTYSASAASSDDGRLIVVRLTSWAAMPIRVLLNGTTASSASSLRGSYVATIVGNGLPVTALNTPSDPEHVTPVQMASVDVAVPLLLPPHSFAVATIDVQTPQPSPKMTAHTPARHAELSATTPPAEPRSAQPQPTHVHQELWATLV